MTTDKIIQDAARLATECIDAINRKGCGDIFEEDGIVYKELYIGTVFNNLPSGKYYTCFANSNVNPCQTCKGTGVILNKHCNEKMYIHARELELALITKMKDEGKTYHTMDTKWHMHINAIRSIINSYKNYVGCPECHGHGSREVYEDEIFLETFDRIIASENCYRTDSPGCPTDMVIGKIIRHRNGE